MQNLSVFKEKMLEVGYTDRDNDTLLMRLQLILAIKEELKERGWSQREAAQYLGVAQPRIAEIVGLRVDKFTVELLAKHLRRLGREVELTIR
jgi:predicted XRE-type DNA-binding protein